MTAVVDLISRAERDRLLERLAELDDLGRLMRERGGLAEAPEPPPLHRVRQDDDTTTERGAP